MPIALGYNHAGAMYGAFSVSLSLAGVSERETNRASKTIRSCQIEDR
jgi:hypothetical protein